jgi:ADP-ribose pyrophosphatase
LAYGEFNLSDEETLSSQLIYDGQIVKLRVDTVSMPGGREAQREIVGHCPCVAIVAVDSDDNVLLVKQFRMAVKKELLEIPAGGIDPAEDPVTAVRHMNPYSLCVILTY